MFTKAGSIYANNIAHWDGYRWESLGSGVNDGVYAIAVSGSDVYAGGSFTEAGGSAAGGIAKWDGNTWSSLGEGINYDVWAIAISGTNIYAGGSFSQAGGSPASNIARWDGSNWSALGAGVDNRVEAIAVSGSDVYAGGNFTQAGESPANSIARWNGSNWFPLGDGIIESVRTIVISGNDVYAGGYMSNAGGIPVNNVAKWNGTNWSVMGSGIHGSDVRAIAITGDDVYVGGQYYQAGEVPASNIARWDGGDWSPLASGVNSVLSSISISENRIYVGGYFGQAGGKDSRHFGMYSISKPTAQPANLSFSNVTSSSFSVSFSAAVDLPDRYIVIRRPGISPTFIPANGSTFTKGQIVGDGTIAYIGTELSFDETGLSAETYYYYDIFSFNGSGPSSMYLTASPLEGNQPTLDTQPAAQPSNLSFSSVTDNSFSVSFQEAADLPDGYLVIRRINDSPTFLPVDGTTYTIDQIVGNGTVAYTGSNLTFNETGLQSGSIYYYDVFSYNGSAGTINYLTVSPLEGSQTTLVEQPSAQPTNLTFLNITTSSFLVSFTEADGSPVGYIVIRREGTSPTFVPVNGMNYTIDQTVGDGTVVYTGSSFSFNQSGLNPNTVYYYKIFSYNGSGNAINYLSINPLAGNQTTLFIEPIAQPTDLKFSNITTSSFSVSFTGAAGSPHGYIAIRKEDASPTFIPVDGVTYTTSQTVGDGTVANVGSALTFNETGLNGGITYYYTIYSYNGIGETINYLSSNPLQGYQSTISTDVTGPAISNLAYPSLANINSSIVIEAAVTDASGINRVDLFYRISGFSSFTQIQMTMKSLNNYEGNIPNTSVTANGLEFYIQAEDNIQNLSSGDINYIKVSIPNGITNPVAQYNGNTLSSYRIFSIPIQLDNPSPSAFLTNNPELGQYDQLQYRWYAIENNDLREYPNIGNVLAGKGFLFLCNISDFKFNTGSGKSIISTIPFEIGLPQGWSLIGNPFNFQPQISSSGTIL